MKLDHLDGGQHLALAVLLQDAQKLLEDASNIVARAPYTDETLRAMRTIQERLIDPLREVWEQRDWGGDNPYPSVGYCVSPRRTKRTSTQESQPMTARPASTKITIHSNSNATRRKGLERPDPHDDEASP